MAIVKDAQDYLATLKIDQWQDGYPTIGLFEKDIANKECFVITNAKNQVMGTVMFTTLPEPTYKTIDGMWLTSESEPYGIIHRLAVSNAYRSLGIAKYVFDYFEQQLIEKGISNLKIDTHPDNLGMQKLIKNRGYQYCGVITLESKAIRLAYEKVF
jgi:ribosomal protein S18 acetylase RimI-like enzyme